VRRPSTTFRRDIRSSSTSKRSRRPGSRRLRLGQLLPRSAAHARPDGRLPVEGTRPALPGNPTE
jgi:hypothetical protein